MTYKPNRDFQKVFGYFSPTPSLDFDKTSGQNLIKLCKSMQFYLGSMGKFCFCRDDEDATHYS